MSDPVDLPLDRIVPDPRFQPRAGGLSASHVRLLMESDPRDWPPVEVSLSDDGLGHLIDGFHRYEAARRLGLRSLRAVIVPGAGYPEAVAANLRHGLPLSLADRKEAALWHLAHEPHLSYREVGRRVGISDKTVKAAIAAETRAPRSPAAPNPVRRFVSHLLKADDEGTINVRSLQREIEAYEDDGRAAVAASLDDIGEACIAAAAPYLERR